MKCAEGGNWHDRQYFMRFWRCFCFRLPHVFGNPWAVFTNFIIIQLYALVSPICFSVFSVRTLDGFVLNFVSFVEFCEFHWNYLAIVIWKFQNYTGNSMSIKYNTLIFIGLLMVHPDSDAFINISMSFFSTFLWRPKLLTKFYYFDELLTPKHQFLMS